MRREDVLLPLRAIRVGAALSVRLRALRVYPVVDVFGFPDLALREVGYGSGEVGAAGDLVDALPADSAQADADLMGADETDRYYSHASP
jgi:hypothetical protein